MRLVGRRLVVFSLVVAVANDAGTATTIKRSMRAAGDMMAECRVGSITFSDRVHYLRGERRVPGSVYGNCDDGHARCFVDDGIPDTPDAEISCDEVSPVEQAKDERPAHVEAQPVQLEAPSTACTVGSVTFSGLSHYLVGYRRRPQSVYADCDGHGNARCYEDDGISDTLDREIDCRSVDFEQRRRELGVFIRNDHAWPERVICVTWESAFTPKYREFFSQAFKEYLDKTDLVFMDVKDCRKTYGENTKVCNNCQTAVRLKSDAPGCFANVGFNSGGYKPELNLGGRGCEWYDTVLHEMGHVVGLFHEHAHPKREVVILRNKIRVGSSNYVMEERAQITDYDKQSIMHYDGDEMCIPRDKTQRYCDVSQTARDGCVVPTENHCDRSQQQSFGTGKVLSENDIKSIRKLYENVPRHPKSPHGAGSPPPPPPSSQNPAPGPGPSGTSPESPSPTSGGITNINFENLESTLNKLGEFLKRGEKDDRGA